MDNQTTYYFAISHKDDPTVAIKHLTVTADTQKLATDFANQEFEEYKSGLLLEPEEFEQIVFSTKKSYEKLWLYIQSFISSAQQTDNLISYYFAISHKDDPAVVIKWLTENSDSQEIATDFANQEFEEYKNGLLLEPEEYAENLITNDFEISHKDEPILSSKYPEKLTEKNKAGFAWFPISFDLAYEELADIAETEDWEYHLTPSEYARPILTNYIRYTYKRLAQEKKIAISEDSRFSCFNTGLVTNHQEQIYAFFEARRKKDGEPWVFKGWFRHGDHKLTIFSELPNIANYINDPACLYFDSKKDFRINVEHLIENTRRERFPEPYKSQTDHALQAAIRGSIDNTKERVRRNYKTAIPCFYRDKIHLLLPLCLKDPKHADLALAIEINENGYRAATCLTLSMAYCDARLIAKPDKEWLIP